jgi:small subunit ribosomal protein S29
MGISLCGDVRHVIFCLIFQGFEHLDPFVPICVREYNERELESCLDYYIDRRWLQNEKSCTEEGRKEFKYLCDMNPRRLMHICAPL